MKKTLSILAIMSTVLVSCVKSEISQDGENPESTFLNVYYDDIVFPSKGGQEYFGIESNIGWTISNSSDWLTIEPTEGTGYASVTLTASASDVYEDRNTVITVKAGDKTETFTVTQKYVDALLVTKNKFEIPQEGGDFTIEIKSNISYEIEIDANSQSWITEVPQSKALTTYSHTFNVSENPNTSNRQGLIIIKGDDGKSETINIFQAPVAELVLSGYEFTIPGEGGELTVELRTNIDYYVSYPTDIDWLKQLPSEREDKLVFEIAPNNGYEERWTSVLVASVDNELTRAFSITQLTKTTIDGDVTLTTDDDIKALCDAGFESINGDLTISGNKITTLSNLDNKIKEINGDLFINCSSLKSLDGLYSLNNINGDFHIKRAGVSNFEGLNNLNEISGNFIIGETRQTAILDGSWLNSLTSFEGLDNLTTIGGTLSILYEDYYWSYNVTRCGNLSTFKGLKSLKEIGGLKIEDVHFESSASPLDSFEGLELLEKIKGDFIITSEDEGAFKYLSSFNGLNNLKEITGKFTVANVDGDLTSYEGLDNLETIGTFNSLNNALTFVGLNNLKSISNDFTMHTSIESLEGLNSLEYIGGNFTPKGSFTSFKGLESLNSVEGNFIINKTSLPNLSSLEGLTSLSIVNGDLEIINMPELQDLKSLNNLSTVSGTLHLTGDLLSLEGLNNLYSVGNLDVSLNITSFNGINIQKVTNIKISSCSQLSDLSALSNSLQYNVNDITIQNCKSLYDFSSLVPLVEHMTGTWLVNGCGYNPTKYQMLNGESKPQE